MRLFCNHTRQLVLTILMISGVSLYAQESSIHYKAELSAGYCGPDYVPFWLRSNQYGSIPPSGAFVGFLAGANKDFNQVKRKADWGFGLEGRLYAGNPTNFDLLESYLKFRYGIFQIKGGRSKDFTGLCDTSLTSGSWSVSGNAPGIPKIELSVEEYRTLPFFGRLFAFKGNYVHGWMGNWYIDGEYVPNTSTYLHQKSLYGRFGNEKWKMKLYGGFNHQVVWGDEKDVMGSDYELNNFQTFIYINSGRNYSNKDIVETRIGDHLGSIDLGLTYEFKYRKLYIYRQNLFEAGALYYFANILDGLNGISLVNKQVNNKMIIWRKFLIELLYTKNQAGESWSRWTPTIHENYYNNGYYNAGWSYKGLGIGNPFVSPATLTKKGFPHDTSNFFINNRIAAIHIGIEVDVRTWIIIGKFSYSRNYGTFHTSATGKAFPGVVYPSPFGVFPEIGQFSGYLECTKNIKDNTQFKILTSFDVGDLYYNSFGMIVKISKYF